MSTGTQVGRHQKRTSRRPPSSVTFLAVLLLLLAIGSIQGGWAMVTNPVDPLGMSPAYLEQSPVSDYFWPGMFLLGIAVASLITIPGLFGWNWDWAAPIESRVGYRWPWLATVSIGLVLLTFEIIELFIVPFHPVMHPLLLAGSAAIAGLPFLASVRSYFRVGG